MNSSEIEPINYGPAAVTLDAGEKGISISFGTIMTGRDVEEAPLIISEVKEHTCEYDEKTETASRIVNGVKMKADSNKMKKIRDNRKETGRKIINVRSNNKDIEH